MLSSIIRSQLFLAVTLRAGWKAALGAMAAEFAYRSATAGFYGAMTQCFRDVEPAWKGAGAAAIVLPVLSHSMELLIHWLRGTPHLSANIGASIGFTAVSTAFNWYAMRQGMFVVGAGSASMAADIRRVPRTIAAFLMDGPRAVWRLYRTRGRRVQQDFP